MFAPPGVVKLYVGDADSGDPTEIHVEVAVDVELASSGLADSCCDVSLRSVGIQCGDENYQSESGNPEKCPDTDQNATSSLSHMHPTTEYGRKRRTMGIIQCDMIIRVSKASFSNARPGSRPFAR